MIDTTASDLPIPIGSVRLAGTLTLPREPRGIIVFLHGSGSNRFSPRNRHVARKVEQAGFATLLLDLLTAEEQAFDSQSEELRFDIPLLAERVVSMLDWLEREPQTVKLPLGLFGASTGATAAIVAAAHRPSRVQAVVARGGRPDLADAELPNVNTPTLLLVGSEDRTVLELNRAAADRFGTPPTIVVVPGATHLFEEPGTLDVVAKLAVQFFNEHLAPLPS